MKHTLSRDLWRSTCMFRSSDPCDTTLHMLVPCQDFFRTNSDCRMLCSVECAADCFQEWEHLKSTHLLWCTKYGRYMHTRRKISLSGGIWSSIYFQKCLSLPHVHREGRTVGMAGSPAGGHWGGFHMDQMPSSYFKYWRYSQEWHGYEMGD